MTEERLAEIRERLYPTREGYSAEPLDIDEARDLLAEVDRLKESDATVSLLAEAYLLIQSLYGLTFSIESDRDRLALRDPIQVFMRERGPLMEEVIAEVGR